MVIKNRKKAGKLYQILKDSYTEKKPLLFIEIRCNYW
jgi:hypothetical protein